MIKNLFHNKVFKNAGWIISGKMIQMLINLVVGLITARYLGPSNYGLISYAGAYTAFFSSFCTLGINSVIVKELIDNPEKTGTIIGTTLGLRAVSSFLSALTIICISFVVDANEPVTIAVVALCSIGVLFQVFDTFNYWFQAKLQSRTTAIVTLIAYVITAIYKVILLIEEKPVTYFALATSIDYFCIAVLLFFCYKKYHGNKLSFSWNEGKDLLKKSVHFILPGLMVAIYGQTDKIMLKHMISEAEVGYYSTALSLCNMWCFILSAIIDSLYPPIMESYRVNKEDFDKKNRLLYAIVFYLSVVVSLIFTIFGKFIVKLLYGQDYLSAVSPLRVITWYTAFSYLGVARNAWIVCMNRQKYLKYLYVAAAAVNIVLNCALIPVLGATGAAIASLSAQIITTFVIPFFIKDLRENSVLMLEAITFKGIRQKDSTALSKNEKNI